MDRPPADLLCRSSSIPRASGDGPEKNRWQLKEVERIPRASGDGPGYALFDVEERVYSPRERGWTESWHSDGDSQRVFPARAGMDRQTTMLSSVHHRIPRASGDGPDTEASKPRDRARVPRASGDGPRMLTEAGMSSVVFPARAGMDRR